MLHFYKLPLFFCLFFTTIFVLTHALQTFLPRNNEERTNDLSEVSISSSIYSFGTDLMSALAGRLNINENAFVSPLSAYTALSMLYQATAKQNHARLNEVLKLPNSDATLLKLHENLRTILWNIAKMPSPRNQHTTSPEVILSNKLFVDAVFPINDAYRDYLSRMYNAAVCKLNFTENEEATDIINSWVFFRTKHRIEKFFAEPLPQDTVAILVSAIYFQAQWQTPFKSTAMEEFQTEVTRTKVAMMSGKDDVPYYKNDNLQFESIELPYAGGEYAMMVVLPYPSQTVRKLIRYIHSLDINEYKRSLNVVPVRYKLPKVKISSKISVVEALQLRETLDALELSTLTPAHADILIRDIKQAADLEINENSTIATGVTAVEFEFRSLMVEDPVQFVVNRPFMIHIVHKPTYTLLFGGIIHQPGESQS